MADKKSRLHLVPNPVEPPPREIDPAWQRELDAAAKHGVTYDQDTGMPSIKLNLGAMERRVGNLLAEKQAGMDKLEARNGLEIVPEPKPKKRR